MCSEEEDLKDMLYDFFMASVDLEVKARLTTEPYCEEASRMRCPLFVRVAGHSQATCLCDASSASPN